MKIDVLVIGAGFAGSTAARILAERGKRVLLLERLNDPAGHCFDYTDGNGIIIHRYGPHIFHTQLEEVWEFVRRFADFHDYQHRVLSSVQGKLLPFPINLDTLKGLVGTGFGEDAEAFLKGEVEKSEFHSPPKNFRDVVVSQIGEKLYELFYKNYTIKQWERDPEELSPAIARRIPVRYDREDRYFTDLHQGIPLNGYTGLVKRMLDHPNIRVRFGEDYFDVRREYPASLVVYTGELDRFFEYRHGKLEYRSLRFDLRTYDREWFQDAAVVNYPNDHKWTRITEFKHFLPASSSRTTVYYEYPQKEGEPYYVVLTDDNLGRREKYMRETSVMEETGEFLFVGRLAEYRYYNMDDVIHTAMKKTLAWLEKHESDTPE